MEVSLLIALALAILTGVALLVVALWRHKKASGGEVKLLGELGRVESKLDPEGTIIVAGELWLAKSIDDAVIEAGARVRVIRMDGHLALVEMVRR